MVGGLHQGDLAAAGLVFLAVAFGVVALGIVVEWAAERGRSKEVARQLAALSSAPGPAAGGLVRADLSDQAPWLRPVLERLPRIRDLDVMIRQAALGWTLQTYLLLTAGFALALGLGAAIAFGPGLIAVILAAVGAALPYLYVRNRRTARMNRFEEQLPDAVDLIGRAIRSGHPLAAGLRMVADEAHDPVAGEFRQVAEEQRFGLPFEDSMSSLADRVPLVDVRILITAVLVQREVGGNLAEILDKIAYVIRERFTIRRQLRVITAEGRMSMWVLMALPFAMAAILFIIHPTYILTLTTDPIGHKMIIAWWVMIVLGFLWIRKIVQIEI
jgi:tight adherence protein B